MRRSATATHRSKTVEKEKPSGRSLAGADRPAASSEHDLDFNRLATRKTRWRWRRLGLFPEPRRIAGRNLYLTSEILEWLSDPEGWAQRHKGGAA